MINSANEEAVEAFLNGKIKYNEIYEIIESAYNKVETADENDISSILETDKRTRIFCREIMHKRRQ